MYTITWQLQPVKNYGRSDTLKGSRHISVVRADAQWSYPPRPRPVERMALEDAASFGAAIRSNRKSHSLEAGHSRKEKSSLAPLILWTATASVLHVRRRVQLQFAAVWAFPAVAALLNGTFASAGTARGRRCSGSSIIARERVLGRTTAVSLGAGVSREGLLRSWTTGKGTQRRCW